MPLASHSRFFFFKSSDLQGSGASEDRRTWEGLGLAFPEGKETPDTKGSQGEPGRAPPASSGGGPDYRSEGRGAPQTVAFSYPHYTRYHF